MEDVAIIYVLTMVTVNTCGAVYIGKLLVKLICKVVHYINVIDEVK